jgi:hypothetical protein
MPISQLTEDAGTTFGLEPEHIILVLFGMVPVTLRSNSTVAGPPRLTTNAVVMVFYTPNYPSVQGFGPRQPGYGGGFVAAQPAAVIPTLNSKLLSTFKLPKFDGVARSWKAWDKAFQRFLGLHQLDHVLEADFRTHVWAVAGAREANKLVFFLIEDAVAPGTLGSKLVRQATK